MSSKQLFDWLLCKSAVVVLVEKKKEWKVCAADLGQEGGRFGYGCVVSDIKFTYSTELEPGKRVTVR